MIAAAVAGAVPPLVPGCNTCDGGWSVTFVRETSGTEATIRGVEDLGDGGLVAVGDDGMILTRGAKGRWSLRIEGTKDLSAVASHAVGTQVFLTAVGPSGTIVSSVDGGLSWEADESGTSADLRDVAYGTAAVAVGDGIILRSAASKQAWAPVGPPDGVGSLHAVASLKVPGDPARFVAVGDGGAVFFSDNDGVDWIRRDAGTMADLRAAGVYRGGDGLVGTIGFWIAGDDGTVRAMLDSSGERWKQVELGLDADVVGVTRESDWLLASDGSFQALYGTLGPSEPWVVPDEQAQHRLLGIAGSFDEVWLVGEAGTIVHARVVMHCSRGY